MNYAKIRNYDIANGEGVRTSLFVSGCTNHCPGCFNSEEQDFNCGRPPDILIYLCDEIGASTERNVCACTIDLAQQNNLTLAELFKKYLG